MRIKLFALLAATLVCAVGGPLQAANLLINGDFETLVSSADGVTPYTHSTVINGANTDASLPGWSTSGYNFVFRDNPAYGGLTSTSADDYFGAAYTSASGGSFLLWGPDNLVNPSANGLTSSPTGGNFVGGDGAYLNAPIFQVLTGLEVGREYSLSFSWAAAQQYEFSGPTSESWTICFGTCSFTSLYDNNGDGYSTFTDLGDSLIADPNNPGSFIANSQLFTTSTVNNANHGFVPWQTEYTTFRATSSTQTLSLLAYGTPLGQPPFALIDGLQLQAVPEPTTWAMMLIGFGVIGGVMRTRRPSLTDRRALNAQIV